MSTAVHIGPKYTLDLDLTPYVTYECTTSRLQIGTQRYTDYHCAIDQTHTFSD
jgi:hypothetical protein